MSEKAVPVGPRMRELEKVIERGMQSFVDVGNALLAIKVEKRYRERGFKTFDDYVRDHWQMGRAHAYRMIDAAKVVEELSPIGDIPSESQARELARSDQPAEVWAEVVDQHAPHEITAKVIRNHAEARTVTTTTSGPAPLMIVDCSAVTTAVRSARRAGATTQEIYDAYQRGMS